MLYGDQLSNYGALPRIAERVMLAPMLSFVLETHDKEYCPYQNGSIYLSVHQTIWKSVVVSSSENDKQIRGFPDVPTGRQPGVAEDEFSNKEWVSEYG